MRSLLVGVGIAALLLAACAPSAVSWDYFYGGEADPTTVGWSRYGAAEQPVWDVDIGGGNKALVVSHDAVTFPTNQPYYQYNHANRVACILVQMRFRIEGGEPRPDNTCYYERFRYNDDRSRLWRYSGGGTGDDFWDPDMVSDSYMAPFDDQWHVLSYLMVGGDGTDPLNPINNYGAANPGAWAYLDGVLVATRGPNLTSNAGDFQIGIVRQPPASFGTASLYVDYIGWAFDDTKDEFGNYGTELMGLVPEPSSLLALGAGLAGAACTLRRRVRR